MSEEKFSIIFQAGDGAFGSGEHPTTRAIIQAMQIVAKMGGFDRILDMGCGAGLLSLIAAHLWPQSRIIAIDHAADAVATAGENIRANGLHARIAIARSQGYRAKEVQAGVPYDLVLCNTSADMVIPLASDLAGVLADGGVAILSGVLAWREKEVLAVHAQHGMELFLPPIEAGEWRSYILRKTG